MPPQVHSARPLCSTRLSSQKRPSVHAPFAVAPSGHVATFEGVRALADAVRSSRGRVSLDLSEAAAVALTKDVLLCGSFCSFSMFCVLLQRSRAAHGCAPESAAAARWRSDRLRSSLLAEGLAEGASEGNAAPCSTLGALAVSASTTGDRATVARNAHHCSTAPSAERGTPNGGQNEVNAAVACDDCSYDRGAATIICHHQIFVCARCRRCWQRAHDQLYIWQ